jgi:short-chain Z-isoprenyl diphosphate synthase
VKQFIKSQIKRVLYPIYERRLLTRLDFSQTPRHVGIILDGNRRWAKSALGAKAEVGHQHGAAKIFEVLNWCEQARVEVVTLWLLSTDNFKKRDGEELEALLKIINDAVTDLAELSKYQVRVLGSVELFPSWMQEKLAEAERKSANFGAMIVNAAIGYGGRQEIVDAVKGYLNEGANSGKSATELSAELSIEAIGNHLYTKGLPDPELLIRTSGEQRLGGFLLWQSALSEFYFCEAYWPDFRRVDFLRALRAYSQRHRRFGK